MAFDEQFPSPLPSCVVVVVVAVVVVSIIVVVAATVAVVVGGGGRAAVELSVAIGAVQAFRVPRRAGRAAAQSLPTLGAYHQASDETTITLLVVPAPDRLTHLDYFAAKRMGCQSIPNGVKAFGELWRRGYDSQPLRHCEIRLAVEMLALKTCRGRWG